jgi:RHS repeat-associated protein
VEVDGLTVAQYAYDAFERRVMKVVNGLTTHFHYDLNGLLISETDGNGNPRKDYVYLNGEPVAMKVYGGSAGWYWFINDHLGTPQKMVDESGSVVWATAYAPFGEARVYKDEVTNNLRFPGQYYDVETGLHYNWHRYYDPGTGRYLRPDPIGLAGGINPYVYAAGNPTNFIDLDGLKIVTGSRMEIEEKVGVPSFSLSTMDFYELMVMAMYPEVLVPMMIGEGILKGCAPKSITKVDPNKLRHIFGQSRHNLDALVKQFGSQEKAFNALQTAAETAVRSQGIKGVFETSVKVGTETITVRGNVIEGGR